MAARPVFIYPREHAMVSPFPHDRVDHRRSANRAAVRPRQLNGCNAKPKLTENESGRCAMAARSSLSAARQMGDGRTLWPLRDLPVKTSPHRSYASDPNFAPMPQAAAMSRTGVAKRSVRSGLPDK